MYTTLVIANSLPRLPVSLRHFHIRVSRLPLESARNGWDGWDGWDDWDDFN
jgi:hypothetical protein